jgi:hypothetical protein
MTFQWPLQLHNDFCDLVTIIVEKDNSHFFDWFKTHNVLLM